MMKIVEFVQEMEMQDNVELFLVIKPVILTTQDDFVKIVGIRI